MTAPRPLPSRRAGIGLEIHGAGSTVLPLFRHRPLVGVESESRSDRLVSAAGLPALVFGVKGSAGFQSRWRGREGRASRAQAQGAGVHGPTQARICASATGQQGPRRSRVTRPVAARGLPACRVVAEIRTRRDSRSSPPFLSPVPARCSGRCWLSAEVPRQGPSCPLGFPANSHDGRGGPCCEKLEFRPAWPLDVVLPSALCGLLGTQLGHGPSVQGRSCSATCALFARGRGPRL